MQYFFICIYLFLDYCGNHIFLAAQKANEEGENTSFDHAFAEESGKYCQYKNGYSKINCDFTAAVTSYVP